MEIDCTDRPFSGAVCDFGVAAAVFDVSCGPLVDADGADCPAALLNRLSSSLTRPLCKSMQWKC